MIRRFVFFWALLASLTTFLVTAEAPACHRHGGGCYTPCYETCYVPTQPCCSCFATAMNPFAKGPGQPYDVLVWCPSCPTHLPCYTWCYIYHYKTWAYANVFHLNPNTDTPKPSKPDKVLPQPKPVGSADGPATIIVSLPADAILTIDGTPTKATSDTRTFVTPSLESGKEYYYTFQATVSRDGKPVSMTRRVTVFAGEETRVTLEEAGVSTAAR